jgi:hypothetical protein
VAELSDTNAIASLKGLFEFTSVLGFIFTHSFNLPTMQRHCYVGEDDAIVSIYQDASRRAIVQYLDYQGMTLGNHLLSTDPRYDSVRLSKL